MNGIVSQNMRNLGANYKINFGLTLPLLKKIAEEIPADAQLANALWNDTAVRESMMLAPMLYPADEFNEDEAEKWVTNMPNIEIADICCKSLFRRLRFAPRKALSWSLSDKMIRQYTGLHTSFENFYNWALVFKTRWVSMYNPLIITLYFFATVNSFAKNIEHTTKYTFANWYFNTVACSSNYHILC